jgi:hypothetical protein
MIISLHPVNQTTGIKCTQSTENKKKNGLVGKPINQSVGRSVGRSVAGGRSVDLKYAVGLVCVNAGMQMEKNTKHIHIIV